MSKKLIKANISWPDPPLYYQHWLKLLQKKSVFNLAEFPSLKLPSYVNSFMYLFGGKKSYWRCFLSQVALLHTYLFCSTILLIYLHYVFWKYSSLYLEISNIVLDTISLPLKHTLILPANYILVLTEKKLSNENILLLTTTA